MTFAYRLERQDGTPADPPTLRSAVSSWHVGDSIPLGRDRTLRVIDIRAGTSLTKTQSWWSNSPRREWRYRDRGRREPPMSPSARHQNKLGER